jgi:hypothetical protein
MISRRGFLVVGAGLAAAAAGGAYLARPHIRGMLHAELDLTYPLGVLSEEEARTVAALGETLAAPQSVPPAEFFREFVDRVTRSQKGYLKEYQQGAALLDATAGRHMSGRGFAELDMAARDRVLGAVLWQYSSRDRIVRKAERLGASRAVLGLRQYVVTPLIGYYYRSEYGWQVVGYDMYPGVARSLADYTIFPVAAGLQS